MILYVGKTLQLKGLTTKGKNRIREHGEKWILIKFRKDIGLLQSVNTGYLKWGPAPDFEIVNELKCD